MLTTITVPLGTLFISLVSLSHGFSEILNASYNRAKVEILFLTKTKLSCAVCKGAPSMKQMPILAKWQFAAATKKCIFYLYLQLFFLPFHRN